MSRAVVYLFKQKTAYDVRISDWRSGVCSSDLRDDVAAAVLRADVLPRAAAVLGLADVVDAVAAEVDRGAVGREPVAVDDAARGAIGGASCRDREYHCVSISVVAVSLTNNEAISTNFSHLGCINRTYKEL